VAPAPAGPGTDRSLALALADGSIALRTAPARCAESEALALSGTIGTSVCSPCCRSAIFCNRRRATICVLVSGPVYGSAGLTRCSAGRHWSREANESR